MKSLVAFIVGLIFAIGLGVGGMTQTHVVRGFLDVTREWDYSIIGVMIGAISVHSLLYFFIRKKKSPLLDSQFYLPTKKEIDRPLIVGAALFGLDWTGLDWTGLDWTGLDWTGLGMGRHLPGARSCLADEWKFKHCSFCGGDVGGDGDL